MSSVTFPTNLGGDGSTVTDDNDPNTGLRNGGWRTRFVPCLTNTVAIANTITERTIFGSDTSNTSVSVTVSSKVFTTAGVISWAPGMFVTIARTSAAVATNMYGQVTAYNSTTKQLTVNVTNITGSGTFSDWTIAIAPPGLAAFSFTGATTIAVNSASDALRITQTGSGNALVVEDASNPDGTPFVIDSTGRVLQGVTTSYPPTGLDLITQFHTFSSNQGAGIYNWSTAGAAPGGRISLLRSNSNVPGVYTTVTSSAQYGQIDFWGSDGTTFIEAARITAQPDGTPGANDMPGRLLFSTTADGATTPTERMRIDSAGSFGFGGNPITGATIANRRGITGSSSAYGYVLTSTVQSDVTGYVNGYFTNLTTAAASFTLPIFIHYGASASAFGAGSVVTNQYGFHAGSTLTGATNNYGFYSNLASGTGRYNFYAAGTADNYFAGNVGIGVVSPTFRLDVSTDAAFYGVRVGRGAGAIISNTMVGNGALDANTTGSSNTASGFQALALNTTGVSNTANGVYALQSNTTGNNNLASGTYALQDNTTGGSNTANGYQALKSNTTASSNTAYGAFSLSLNTTGISNTANGVNSLAANTTGSNNTAIGAYALQNNTTGSGNTAINPRSNTGAYAPVFDPTTENNRFCCGSTAVTNAYIQVAWTVVSDARDKTNVDIVPHGLDFVTKLNPIAYQFRVDRNSEETSGGIRYGFRAQDILALEGNNPVIVDNEDSDKLRITDTALIPVLVNAIKEQQTLIDALFARLEALEKR